MYTTVIIPTYNEAGNLPRLISALFSLPLDLHVLIVDDNSPDGTGRLADDLASSHPDRLQVVHRSGKLGLRSAYLDGFQQAFLDGAEVVVQMDADFSHDPQVLPDMVKRLHDHDLVLGSRYIPGGRLDDQWPLWRKGLSAWGNLYARTILGLPLRDVTTGYRVWKADSLKAMPLDRIRANGYIFLVEMAYQAYCLKFKIFEYPIYFLERTAGRSKMSLRIQVEAALRVWQVRRAYRDLRRRGGMARRLT